MENTAKKKKNMKWFWVTLLITISVAALVITTSIFVICKDTKLDTEKLNATGSTQNITYYDHDGEIIHTTNETALVSELSDHTKNAFISKEDKRFYKHNGYDIVRIFGAMKNNISQGKFSEGASTISQQLVKNSQLDPEKTIKRKVEEIYLARRVEKQFKKDEILEMYLNAIYFGNNRYGIENASIFYFNKPAKELSLSESAMLAGIITAPSNYNPIANREIAKEKRNLVLSLMQEQGYITIEEMQSAQSEELIIDQNNAHNADEVYLRLARSQASEILGHRELPTNVKIKIHTNIDHSLQRQIKTMIDTGNYTEKNNNGIMSDIVCVVIDNKTCNVVAYNGKSDFDLTTLRRQPASIIKPIIVYAPAIDDNIISPSTFVLDEPIDIGGYSPENSAYGFCGWTTVRDSLVRSLNIPPVKLLNSMGVDKGKNFAEKMGITFADNDTNLAVALGGMTDGVTFLELANAFSIFAREGEKLQPSLISKIYINGERIFENTNNPERVMKDSTAYLITDMLEDVIDAGTARKLASLDYDIACKTGTTGAGEKNIDAWNVSYTTEHTVLVWIGNTHGEKGIMQTTTNGSTYPTFFVKSIFEYLYKTKKPADFIKPDSVVLVELDSSCFDNQTLKLATENTPKRYIMTELFATDNQPAEYSDNFAELVAPTIWVEYEDNPVIKFKSQSSAVYDVKRQKIDVETTTSYSSVLTRLLSPTNQTQNTTLDNNEELITRVTGNGRNLLVEDELGGAGRFEYFVVASNDTETKTSNKVRVLRS